MLRVIAMVLVGCASPPAGEGAFTLRIENVAPSSFPTALGAGVIAVHSEHDPLFREGEPDDGRGLEALAEDGDPSALASTLGRSWTFEPLEPGESIVVEIAGGAPMISFAAMIAASNDVFVAAQNVPLTEGELGTSLWNAGTEVDQPPRFGAAQAMHQPAPGMGDPEGVVRRWDHPLRALPLARDLVDVRVTVEGRRVAVDLVPLAGVMRTEISPIVWTAHDGSFRFFTPGEPSSAALESFAEDGAPGDLVHGPISIEADAARPYLDLAARIVETNDAFIAPTESVRIVDASGDVRGAIDIERDLVQALAVWDAGTEENEAPGLGRFQGPRQPAPNSGPPDPIAHVHLYDDARDDLAGDALFDSLDVEIQPNGAAFEVRIHNTSSALLFTSFAWAIHDGSLRLFEPMERASRALEELAEDCHVGPLADELASATRAGVTDGPILPGASISFTVEADAARRFLSIVSMPFPSNDAFVAFGPEGIALLDEDGAPRDIELIARDVRERLRAWDAGTEVNQVGGAGSDQSPHQSAYGAGASEGDGRVRAETDVWSYPAADELLRLTVTRR